ncbi:MAG: TonB-dependent receptor [Candidatus Poribacteria bacterium]|nr:TonB-dependent receptor [Candidatus Poribacteria bacterium]
MQRMKAFFWYLFSTVLFALPIYSPVGFAQQSAMDDGEIHGTVSRRGTGQPLANVSVRLIETGQHTLTDETGAFRFSSLPASGYTLAVSAAGYRAPEDDDEVVTVKPGQTTEVRIYLERVEFILEEIQVKSTPTRPTVGKQTLGALEIKRVPGTAGDALRALQALPGIGVANDFDGQLYIRGGAPEDNRFYLDRAPLFYPYHFGGLVSTINSEVLNKIDVYAGGFGAEFGADAQAVIDIYSRRGREDRVGGKFNLNMLYSEGLLEGPLGERGSWYLAGRRSYIDLLPIEVDEITAFPRFWDYQAKVSYDLSEKHQLHLNAFAADDFMELKLDLDDVENDPTLAGRLNFKDRFNVQGMHLRSTLTNRLTSDLSISRADYFQDFSFGQGLFLKLEPTQYELREDLAYRLNPKHQLESGVLVSTTQWNVSSFFPRPPDEGDPDANNLQYFTFEEKVTSDFQKRFNFIEGYLQNRYDPLAFLSITLGLRLDYFNLTDRVSVGPRGSLRLKIPGGSELRFAYGRYEISPYPWQITPEYGNPDVKENTAIHYILELERQISPQTHLKVASYQKDFSDLITRDQQAGYLNQGNGFARGVEVSLRHREGERFFGWANYAYSVAKRKDRPSEPERLYSFDQTHVATLTTSYQFTSTWEIGAKWQYRTGNPYTPVTGARLVPHPTTGELRHVPIYGETNSARVAPFHRLDVRISKSFIYEQWRLGVFLEVLNVYNHKNVLSFDYNEDYTKQEVVHQLPLIPYLGITAEF